MAPNVFDYIRSCIQHKFKDNYDSYATSAQKYSYWKEVSASSSYAEKIADKVTYDYMYMPSSEIVKTCVNSPPNKDCRELDEYQDVN